MPRMAPPMKQKTPQKSAALSIRRLRPTRPCSRHQASGRISRFRGIQWRLRAAQAWPKSDRGQLTEGLASLVLGKKQLDPALLEALEEQLIMADLGLEATDRVLESLRQRLDRKSLAEEETVMSALKETLVEMLADQEQPLNVSRHRPFVMLVVGVNGAGKTTTIGKLAHRYKQQGLNVMLAAGDTFRAAAVEQLQARESATMCR